MSWFMSWQDVGDSRSEPIYFSYMEADKYDQALLALFLKERVYRLIEHRCQIILGHSVIKLNARKRVLTVDIAGSSVIDQIVTFETEDKILNFETAAHFGILYLRVEDPDAAGFVIRVATRDPHQHRVEQKILFQYHHYNRGVWQ